MERVLRKISSRRQKQVSGLLVFAVIYSCAGFLGAPVLVKKLGQDYVRDTLKLRLSVAKVEVNPWRLALRLDGLSVTEPDGTALVSLQSLYLNVDSLASVWRRQLEVEDLDIVAPVVNARIDASGKLNLLALVPPEDPEDTGETPWRLAALGIHQGHLELRDESRPQPFSTRLEPLELQLYNLSSQTDGAGQYHFEAETGKGERLEWKGSVALNPIRSEGYLAVKGLQAATVADYAQNTLPLTVSQGRISLSGQYRLQMEHEVPELHLTGVAINVEDLQGATVAPNPIEIAVKQIAMRELALDWPEQAARLPELVLRGLAVSDADHVWVSLGEMTLNRASWMPKPGKAVVGALGFRNIRLQDTGGTPLLVLPALQVTDAAVQPEGRRLESGSIHIKEGETRFTRYSATDNNWQRFVDTLDKRLGPPVVGKAAAPASAPWQVALGELSVTGFRVAAEDRTPLKPVLLPLYINQFTVRPERDLQKPHQFEGLMEIGRSAKLQLSGQLHESPLKLMGQVDLQGFDLGPVTPYLSDFARFQLESGKLGLKGKFSVQEAKSWLATYQGSVGIDDFVANDLYLQERFLAWKRLQLRDLDFNLEPMRMKVREVMADQPFTRLMILPDKSLNVSQILAATTPSAPAKPVVSKVQPPSPVDIGKVKVRNGSMLFADLSLKPQFATGIESLNGEIRDISTRPGKVAEVALQGRVDQYGKADIQGKINPLAPDNQTEMALKFENVELTTLTPYSAKFAGYRIDKGKLSLDLNYHIENRRLQATNRVVLNQLTLGEKVDSPDAVNMPLRLALALLKDGKGVIDLDLPISGSLDDPQFRVGPIVWKAFVNVVTKVATAPFRFIAGLVGGGEDMDSLPFEPGAAAVSPQAHERLMKLAQALAQRPQLRVELRGAYDAVLDRQAIRNAHLDDALKAMTLKSPKPSDALEALYLDKFGAESLKQKKALALRPAGGQELALATEAYRASLRSALLEQDAVADGELRQLALDRSRGLRQILIEAGKVEDARVYVLEPEAGVAVDGRVVSHATLNAL